MKTLVYTGPETLDYREAPDPEPGKDALIRVAHVGICGSDMHAWAGHDERRPAPLILGHEVAGTVVDGPGAGGLDIRRMTLQEITFIGTCTYSAADFRETAEAIFRGVLGALDWPEIRPLSEGARAFDEIRAGRAAAPKIILMP